MNHSFHNPRKRILIINGGLGGKNGNTSVVLSHLNDLLIKRCQTETIHLLESELKIDEMLEFDGFIFGTGTYWDSWSSPFQKFLEEMTKLEASGDLLGKPAAVIVTMHSVGGKEVLSRIQGVLNTLGLYTPPMSAMVYSTVNQFAIQNTPSKNNFIEDIWSLEDLEIVAHNLSEACYNFNNWKAWSVDRKTLEKHWINEKI